MLYSQLTLEADYCRFDAKVGAVKVHRRDIITSLARVEAIKAAEGKQRESAKQQETKALTAATATAII